MKLQDSQILINDAKNLLGEIEIIYNRDIKAGEDSPLLRVRIKQFLDNINSCLDYAAFYIFTKYCADRLKEENLKKFERLEKRIYFPCVLKLSEGDSFNEYMNKKFPYLEEENPDIIRIFEKYQPLPAQSKWLSHLKDLVNSNKHRRLSKQQPRQTMNINQLNFAGGGFISGLTLVGEGTSPLIEFEGDAAQPVYFDGSVDFEFIFKELDQPVLKVLKRIYRSAPSIINDLEKCL